MSVRRARPGVWWARAVGLLLIFAAASSSHAWDILTDPLHAQPPALTTGVTLPGDGGPVPCPAPEDFSRPLSLADAVDAALCDNPQIKATWADIKVQADALGEARAAYLPTLSATVRCEPWRREAPRRVVRGRRRVRAGGRKATRKDIRNAVQPLPGRAFRARRKRARLDRRAAAACRSRKAKAH